ncbi:MAG: PilZ domain-containing protein [Pyrinomonadaceae bacterium]|jgi:hypothetical protein|nr:PilZ domain-containing protein [Blastocatellia bacterium]MDQ3220894.1 PilZ domain-containing protein [Acidobacteriota bacterium]MDQ3489659.1 PilZ domain-containing protein [Acidobacteriota bacterium]
MPRKEERVPFLMEILLESASGKREARISDIGPEGCYIDSIVTTQEGETVSLEISRPDGEAMKFTGKVAYALEGFGFGVRFTDLSDANKTFLEEIIRAQKGQT